MFTRNLNINSNILGWFLPFLARVLKKINRTVLGTIFHSTTFNVSGFTGFETFYTFRAEGNLKCVLWDFTPSLLGPILPCLNGLFVGERSIDFLPV